MVFRNSIYFLLIVVVNLSCSPYSRLSKNFKNSGSSIKYLHSSAVLDLNKTQKVYVTKPVITDKNLPLSGEVKKLGSVVVPLLLVNRWSHEYECSIGKNQITEDLESFVQESFIEEAKRGGAFHVVNDDKQAETGLTLEIEIDSLGANGPYANYGFFVYMIFGYFYQVFEDAGPGTAYCRIHFRLRQDNKILIEDKIMNQSSFELLQAEGMTFQKSHQFYVTNLVESLGDAIRKDLEELVTRINHLLENPIAPH